MTYASTDTLHCPKNMCVYRVARSDGGVWLVCMRCSKVRK